MPTAPNVIVTFPGGIGNPMGGPLIPTSGGRRNRGWKQRSRKQTRRRRTNRRNTRRRRA